MANDSESFVTDVYFYCPDAKKKREIANLFRYKNASNRPPENAVLSQYHQTFNDKLKKIKPQLTVDVDFFSSVIFGLASSPVVTCPRTKPAYITLLHAGEFGGYCLELVEFIKSIDTCVEVFATTCKLETNIEYWMLFKSLSVEINTVEGAIEADNNIQSRCFQVDSARLNNDLLAEAVNSFDWLKQGLTTIPDDIAFLDKNFRSLLQKAMKATKLN